MTRRHTSKYGIGIGGATLVLACSLLPVREAGALECVPGAHEGADIELESVTIDGASLSDLAAYDGFTITLERVAERSTTIELMATKGTRSGDADVFGERYEAR